MPPELSAPSLSSTTAPTGRSAVSSASCFRLSPMRVAGAAGAACSSLSVRNARQASIEAVEARLKFLLQFGEQCRPRAPWRLALRAVAPWSAMAMLRESSTRTAMMFCCGFSSATVIAGCHSSTSTTVARANCSSQITPARQLRMRGGCLRQARADQQRQPRGRCQHQKQQDPLRPAAQQDESPFEKTAPDT